VNQSPYSSAALKRASWHFLSGKVITAVFTFGILLWLVRLLPVGQYGAYVTLVAMLEVAWAIAALGLPWVAARYVPEFLLRGSSRQTAAFIGRLVALNAIGLAAACLLAYLLLDAYLAWAGLSAFRVQATLYLVAVLFIEGISRTLRDVILGPLLQQGIARSSLVAKQVSFIALLGAVVFSTHADQMHVAVIDVLASLLGGGVAAIGVRRYLASRGNETAASAWNPPPLGDMWRTASTMYVSHLISLLSGAQVLLQILVRFAGPDVAATFGFLRNLYEQLARYLPATLLFGLIRPKLVATYVESGSVADLAAKTNFVGKLSLVVLMPAVALVAVSGDALVDILSGGRFEGAGGLLFMFTLALVPFSQRQLLETVAVSSGRGQLCLYASLGSGAGLIVTVVLLALDAGVWAAVLGFLTAQWVFNVLLSAGLAYLTGYRPDLAGILRIFVPALCAAFAASLVDGGGVRGQLVLQALVVAATFVLVTTFARPFSPREVRTLRAYLRRSESRS
jgi:O-antigen/teichoic acid export membrane protein